MSTDIPKSIRWALVETGLQLKAVAANAGIDPDGLSKVKNGKRGVTVQKLDLIAKGFGMKTSEFIALGESK